MARILTDALVIGGGLHGLSAALQIARRGWRVILVERAFIGRHASGASAAGVRTLGRHAEDLELSLESARYWHDMKALVDDDCGFHAGGQLRVAETAAELARLEKQVETLNAAGYHHEVLVGPAELRRIVPALRPDVQGAIWVAGDGAADPHRTLRAFRRACEKAGVTIFENEGVRELERAGGRWVARTRSQTISAGKIVNAAGAWAHHIAGLAGEDFPLETKASMMMVTERVAPFIEPVVSAVGRTLSFKQSDRGTLVIGGGLQGRALLDAEQTEPCFLTLARGARAASELFPGVGELRVNRVWSGLEAKTPDMVPVIGASEVHPDVVHVFGFSGHGFQLVPVAGFAVADLVTLGRTARVIGQLGPGRFAAGSASLQSHSA